MIAQLRCQQHPVREAIARCPNCRQSFCRECITEHDGRMLCLPCLAKQSVLPNASPTLWPKLAWTLGAFVSLLLAWVFFLGLGEIFLRASG